MRGLSVSRRTIIGVAGVLLVLLAVVGSAFYTRVLAAPRSGTVQLSALHLSVPSLPKGAVLTGAHASNGQMVIEMVLTPRGDPEAVLQAMNTPGSATYHQYLQTGQFNALFAPSASSVASVRNFLTSNGLHVVSSTSPLLLRATGTTAAVERAFHTTISDYRGADGTTFFQNSSPLMVPAALSNVVKGVLGTTNTHHLLGQYLTAKGVAKKQGKTKVPSYGNSPGQSGLSPSQISSMYNAGPAYAKGANGAGVTIALFELSGYTRADITVYENQFGIPHVGLNDINVDGGPLSPVLPPGDFTFATPDYSGDIEVNLDIEGALAIAPHATIQVYNAPNDFFGLGPVDEYYQIANDNTADTVSSSWASCEQDATFGYAVGEYNAFLQMALQGQSMFAASGDTGAYGCERGSGFPSLAVLDPSSQPYVTAVGGTSFGLYDPATIAKPSYQPETVWNPQGLCTGNGATSTGIGCGFAGASGGGNSIFWYTSAYHQSGPGIPTSQTQFGKTPYPYIPGQDWCQQANNSATPCRTVPDVSSDADEFTAIAEYCTGNPSTNSTCAFEESLGFENPNGWLQVGGTSLAAPTWAGVVAIYNSFHHARFGFANPHLYHLYQTAYAADFHDPIYQNSIELSNGFYTSLKGYDLVTGIGTENISNIAFGA